MQRYRGIWAYVSFSVSEMLGEVYIPWCDLRDATNGSAATTVAFSGTCEPYCPGGTDRGTLTALLSERCGCRWCRGTRVSTHTVRPMIKESEMGLTHSRQGLFVLVCGRCCGNCFLDACRSCAFPERKTSGGHGFIRANVLPARTEDVSSVEGTKTGCRRRLPKQSFVEGREV